MAGLATAEAPHWNYYSEGGAAGWGELAEEGSTEPAFPDCNLSEQSPVNIQDVTPLISGLSVDMQPTDLEVINNGHTIQVPAREGSTMALDGKTYNLLQFHFHSPSEHELDGKQTALEAHFVHQAADGEYAVLGVMIVPGNYNAAFEQVLDTMPEQEGEASGNGTIDTAGLLPGSLSYYAYDGSFTTPPCTQGVNWHVLSTPITVSLPQIAEFRALEFLHHDGEYIGNSRPVQPLNGRLSSAETAEAPDAPGITSPSTGDAGLATDASSEAVPATLSISGLLLLGSFLIFFRSRSAREG